MKIRAFATVEEAVAVLGVRETEERILALEAVLQVVIDNHTHEELAEALHASRESVSRALSRMGRKRYPKPRAA